MKRKVLVNGREIDVDPRQDGASIVEIGEGLYSVLLNGRSFEARVSNGIVEVDGEAFVTEVVDPRAVRSRSAVAGTEGRQTLTAPMPGKIVRLLVSEGQAVEPGQGILVIEAMKMQNEMKAPRAGTVVSLPVEAGSAVASGDVLVVVE